jgi:hypothetical protein
MTTALVTRAFFLILFFLSLVSAFNLPRQQATTKKIAADSMHSFPEISPLLRRTFLTASVLLSSQLFSTARAQAAPPGFRRIRPIQFIAALGDPKAKYGDKATEWGIWKTDPGPRGVYLRDYDLIQRNSNRGPDGWEFDVNDWWLEEHGLIMPPPSFPIAPGRYLVTGGREVTTVLTIDDNGAWKLEDGTLYDVTHLPCRSARYHPTAAGGSPSTAKQSDFPVRPGAEMPKVQGFDKQDYAVLFVVGVEDGAAQKEL